ncbi:MULTISPECIES: class I SAM-dependent methyltransferase [Streptomyces]|uniref:class I SAM-dependent methyltransferase n=1 Tax=Streptomyces TaxID=1883 RepID=UPI00073DDD30|nr:MULTISPECIES: class I SAM-dependent methyltransferase [unclassified Streptomyces]MYU29089.1 hypothetical protein [Streptomyces sp. SID7810]OYP16208.1 class I SAM-dependent methyltransferase [Streptomyces sp. FBKL.4005]BCM68493.1 hypothetical protein EASAB2608_03827 [Streptomyces sp. EAS-AB2608]CUW30143.1 hypothetical protein TUE45_04863 [Streptomyces reticuli]
MTQPTLIRRVALTRPLRVLDAYCCIGGATAGYRLAFPGCHITGVDIQDQPDYCGDAFHQGDAIDFIRAHGHEYDLVHGSWPCERYATVTRWRGDPDAMGCTWMTNLEARKAVPPAYTHWIATQFLALEGRAAA